MTSRAGYKKLMLITAAALVIVLGLAAGELWAQMIEQAEPVPAGAAENELKDLEEQKGRLDSEFEEITQSIQEYNSFCLGGMGAMNAQSCAGRHSSLTGRMSTYQAALFRYRSAIEKSTKPSDQLTEEKGPDLF